MTVQVRPLFELLFCFTFKYKQMGKIIVYNCKEEDHTSKPNNFYIGRSKNGNPLGNPYTFNGKRSNLAKLTFRTRDEAVDAYRRYFDSAYGVDPYLTHDFDEIYEHYKNGEDVYLQCFCKPLRCHGEIIAEELQKKLLREKMREIKRKAEK